MSVSVAASPGSARAASFAGNDVCLLVSTTPQGGNIAASLGAANYSYHFVVEALRPVFEGFRWQLVERPESSLAWHAKCAKADRFQPVHIAINPLHEVYLDASVPNVVFPFWEFPHVPDRAFGHDTRQDWTRVARRADVVLAACGFTAQAMARHGANVAMLPIPVPAWTASVDEWSPRRESTLDCRFVEFDSLRTQPAASVAMVSSESVRVGRAASPMVRRLYQRIAPRLGPVWSERFVQARRHAAGKSVPQIAAIGLRAVYKSGIRDWLSDRALQRVTRVKEGVLRRFGIGGGETLDPPIPIGELRLSGLTYTSFLSVGDPRKNPADILSAFLIAFRNRADVTLVIKLATNRRSAWHEVGLLRAMYKSIGLMHQCRLVVVADYLSDLQIVELMTATTFYLNASHAEGLCLPLQQALAAGRPAVCPGHTAMADYVDSEIAFVVGSDVEPCPWPHDPERRLETLRHRIRWSELHDRLIESAASVDRDVEAYRTRSRRARDRISEMYSVRSGDEALRGALALAVGRS